MDSVTLTITLEGSSDDQGDVRLNEFIEALGAIKAALRQTERIVTGKENTVFYRVVDLRHTSPSLLRIEAVAQKKEYRDAPDRIFRRFTTSLRMIPRRKRLPVDFDAKATEAYENLANPLRKHLRKMIITLDDNREAVINQKFEDAMRTIVGYDTRERTSMMGMMDAMNVHHHNNRFTIFPSIGPERVNCKFPSRLRNKVLSAAGQYVRVAGTAITKSEAKFPYAMEVDDLEAFSVTPPRLSDLRGLAPEATFGMPSEEFVRKIRDEW